MFDLKQTKLYNLIWVLVYYRSLRNARTKIHKNLFMAMVIQVIIRLTLYLDQAIIRNGRDLPNDNMSGIQNTVKISFTTTTAYVL